MRNKERAEWARKAMDVVYEDDTEGNIGDILVDIMHLCKQEGLDFNQRLMTAVSNFNTEAGYFDPPHKHPTKEQKLSRKWLKWAKTLGDRYTIDDWKYEVINGDTILGYEEWRVYKLDVEVTNVTKDIYVREEIHQKLKSQIQDTIQSGTLKEKDTPPIHIQFKPENGDI